MPPLDAVVLAGGKSERLAGIVPSYHKPFIVINGKSLLVTAVDSAIDAGAERVIVMATGENALPVWQLVGHRDKVRVVLDDGGVAHALHVGAEVAQNNRLLVLMSDNVHGLGDVSRVCAETFAIGVRVLPYVDAQRFTRLRRGTWVEGSDENVDFEASPTTVWCGPLVVQRDRVLNALNGKSKIGPHLAELAPYSTLVTVATEDIGTPDAVTDVTRRIT
jgi:hypothetical protein